MKTAVFATLAWVGVIVLAYADAMFMGWAADQSPHWNGMQFGASAIGVFLITACAMGLAFVAVDLTMRARKLDDQA